MAPDEQHSDLAARGQAVLEDLLYLVLGTVGPDGRPWVSPVYFTADDNTDFYWVSSPDARHSRNLAHRDDVSIVVFDSTVPIGGAQAVYLRGQAAEVPDDELERCSAIYCGRLPEARRFTSADLRAPAALRLYRATVTEQSVLVKGSDPVHGRGVDSRVDVDLRTARSHRPTRDHRAT